MLNKTLILKASFVFVGLFFVGLVFPKTTQAQVDPCSSVGPASITKDISRNPVELDSDVEVWIPFPRDTIAGFGPADIMLVMDTSGSMNSRFSGTSGPTKLQVAKQALKAFVSSANLCLNRIGLAQFSDWQNGNPAGPTRIVMNLSNDAAALNAAIDALVAGGGTSIGGGLHRGLEGLLDTAPGKRSGVDGHVVLATDGGQNIWPATYDCWNSTNNSEPCNIAGGSIMQQAINMRVRVWSVGIGASILSNAEFFWGDVFDPTGKFPNQNACPLGGPTRTWVQPTGPSTCPNAILDSEDYMIDVARRTGGNYYYVADASRMDTVYRQILADITRSLGFIVQDIINPRVFTGVDPTRIRVHRIISSCAEANAANDITTTLPSYSPTGTTNPRHNNIIWVNVVGFRPWSLYVNLGFIPRNEGRCVVVPTHVRPDAPLNSQEIDSPWLDASECPLDPVVRATYPNLCVDPPPPNNVFNPGFWQFINPRVPVDPSCLAQIGCLIQNLTRMRIGNNSVIVIDPARPWLRALDGTVGSKTDIDPIRRNLFSPAVSPSTNAFNALFNTITDSSLMSTNWVSAHNWRVANYNSFGGLNITPPADGTGSIYQGFLNNYSPKGINPVGASIANITTEANAGRRLLQVGGAGDLTINSSTYSGAPVVVFVPGNLTITSGSFNTPGLVMGNAPGLGIESGMVLVVRGNVTIARNVNRVDAYIVTDGTFLTEGDTTDHCDPALQINGGAVSYGQFIFQRNLRCPATNPNRDNPAEQFVFPARYYWLFREVIGDSNSVFKEVAP